MATDTECSSYSKRTGLNSKCMRSGKVRKKNVRKSKRVMSSPPTTIPYLKRLRSSMLRFVRKCSSQIRILTIKWRLRSEIGMMLHSKLANKLLQLSNNSLLIMTSWPKILQLKGLCLHHIEWSPITLKVLVKSSKMLFCMSALSKLEKLKWRRQTRRRRSVCGLFNKNTCAVSKCLATERWKRLIVR